MALCRPAGAISSFMSAPWAPYGVPKCTEILAFDVQLAGARLLRHVLVSRFLGSFLKCNFWIVSSMLIKGSHRYRLNTCHIPLQLFGEAHDGSGKPDNVLIGVVAGIPRERLPGEIDVRFQLSLRTCVCVPACSPKQINRLLNGPSRILSYGVCPSCPRTRYRRIEAA